MATFRKRRSRKYRSKNTRKNTRRNARKYHINRRSKKSLVGGINWFPRIKIPYWNTRRRIVPAPTIEAAHTIEATAYAEPNKNVYFEQHNEQEIMHAKEQLEREIEEFGTSIYEEIVKNRDRNIKEDTLSVEDYIYHIILTIQVKQLLVVKLMQTIDKITNNGMSNNEYSELYDAVTTGLLNLNDHYEKIIDKHTELSDKEIAKETAKKIANTSAETYYKGLLEVINVAKQRLYI